MQIEGAEVREQGQNFAIVIVKQSLGHQGDRALAEAQLSFTQYFPGVPIVLMWQDGRGVPTYWGREDISAFLASIDHRQIPWKRYTFN